MDFVSTLYQTIKIHSDPLMINTSLDGKSHGLISKMGKFSKPQGLILVYLRTMPASILYKSIAGRYRHVSYLDGPITARYRFIKNAY